MDVIHNNSHGVVNVSVTFRSETVSFDRVTIVGDRVVSVAGRGYRTLGSALALPETFPGKGSVQTVFPNHVYALCAEALTAGDSVVLDVLSTEGEQQYRKFNPATDSPLLDEGLCFVGGAAGEYGEFLTK